MGYPPYPYEQIQSTRYTFFSIGKMRIEKIVDFILYGIQNIVNLGFGDLRSDGTIDDLVTSNNGDIVKVLATIVEILKDYTSQHPDALVFFKGSTEERNKLYYRILKTYHTQFKTEFNLYGLVGKGGKYNPIIFDPMNRIEYGYNKNHDRSPGHPFP